MKENSATSRVWSWPVPIARAAARNRRPVIDAPALLLAGEPAELGRLDQVGIGYRHLHARIGLAWSRCIKNTVSEVRLPSATARGNRSPAASALRLSGHPAH